MNGVSSVIEWLKSNLSLIWDPGRILLIPLFIVAILGLIFNTMLASRLGFDGPDTFSIGDHVASGVLLVRPAIEHAVLLTICFGLAALTVLLALMVGYATKRVGVMARHRFSLRSARSARNLEMVMKRFGQRFRRLDLSRVRGWLRRRQNRLFREAAKLRRDHEFLEKDRLGLGLVWRSTLRDFGAAWRKSRTSLASLSGLAATALFAAGLLFAGNVAQGAVNEYLAKTWKHMRNSLVVATGSGVGVEEERPKVEEAKLVMAGVPLPEWLWTLPLRAGEAVGGAINHAGQRPRLVSLQLRGDPLYLRPMILILDFGSELILYDFLADSSPDDGRIYPIRTVRAEDVAAIVSAATYDSPDDDEFDASTGSYVRAGSIGPTSAVRGLIAAACGNLESKPAAEPTVASTDGEKLWLSEFHYLASHHIRSHHVVCEEPTDDAPGAAAVFDLSERTLLSLKQAGLGFGALADRYIEATASSASAVQASVDANRQAAADSSAAMRAVAEAIANRKSAGDHLSEPATASVPVYILNLLNGFEQRSGGEDKWAQCEPALAAWDRTDFGLQFQNGKSRLDGPTQNDLEETRTSTGTWETLEAVFDDWAEQIIAIRSLNPKEGEAFLFLIGRASENGDVGVNLRLTERRAAAVKRALLDVARPVNWYATGIDDTHVVAIGEGETGLAPFEDISSASARRVDALLCFVPRPAAETASIDSFN